ncbi:MAG: hypothetical protein WCF04_04570 [Candidatus Nanopelagicales bacterium]
MTCRVVIGFAHGADPTLVRRAVLDSGLPAGTEALDVGEVLPDVLVVRIPADQAPVALLAQLRMIPGVAYAEQERIYGAFDQ